MKTDATELRPSGSRPGTEVSRRTVLVRSSDAQVEAALAALAKHWAGMLATTALESNDPKLGATGLTRSALHTL